jgi:hypothetical protein
MKYLILISLIFLPIFEEIDYSKVETENEKAIIMYIQPIACHVCYLEIDKRIRNLNEKNFKYYILLDSKRSIVERKKIISVYKELGLEPDKYIFASDNDEVKEFNKEHSISYSPILILIDSGSFEIYSYSEIFPSNNKNDNNIEEILNRFVE